MPECLSAKLFIKEQKIVLRMLLKYGDRVNLIPTTSMDGPKFRVLRLDDFDTTYEPQIRLETTVKTNNTSRSRKQTHHSGRLLQTQLMTSGKSKDNVPQDV